jgi:sulfide:quinone oxidoreductase
MSAPDFLNRSPLANEVGWVEVDEAALQHVRYPNMFSLGDASSLPRSKTGAAIRKQAPILVKNLLAAMRGQSATPEYDGYTSCPLATGYGKLILAEFDYDLNLKKRFCLTRRKSGTACIRESLWPAAALLAWHAERAVVTSILSHRSRRMTDERRLS